MTTLKKQKPAWWSHLDSQIAELLTDLEALELKPTHEMTPDEARDQWSESLADSPMPPDDEVVINDKHIAGPGGPLRIRVYRPEGNRLPLLVFFHGGGFCLESVEAYDGLCLSIAKQTPCIVGSVDYRLAPENPFPAAVEDAEAALKWCLGHASEIGADPSRLAVGGDSAGGNLATVSVRRICRSGDVDSSPIKLQWLAYPVVDWSEPRRQSFELFGDCQALSEPETRWYRGHYFVNPNDHLSPDASPLLIDDLSGLPPALITPAEIDMLRDEASDYAVKLSEAGVDVQYRCYLGLVHAFLGMVGMVDAADAALADIVGILREFFRSERD